MEAEIGVVLRAAAFEVNVVADLEGETVAVVVAGDDSPKGEAVAVLNEDGAGVVAVDLFIGVAVTVQD